MHATGSNSSTRNLAADQYSRFSIGELFNNTSTPRGMVDAGVISARASFDPPSAMRSSGSRLFRPAVGEQAPSGGHQALTMVPPVPDEGDGLWRWLENLMIEMQSAEARQIEVIHIQGTTPSDGFELSYLLDLNPAT